jgi:hypothetical protein
MGTKTLIWTRAERSRERPVLCAWSYAKAARDSLPAARQLQSIGSAAVHQTRAPDERALPLAGSIQALW